MKQDKVMLANAVALTTVIVWAVCSLAFVLFPVFSMQITRAWFHGMNIAKLGPWTPSMPDFLLGGVSAPVVAWLIAYTFGTVSESLRKKK